MPVLNPKDISEVRHGDMEIGALFAGDKLMYNKRHLVEYLNAGTYKFLIPNWVNYVSVITVGAGGGGGAAVRGWGKGGAGGQINTHRFSFSETGYRGSMTLTVGSGGLGGVTPNGAGKDGGASSWQYSDDVRNRAEGGAGSSAPSSNGSGGYGYSSLSEITAKHLLREEGSRYFPMVGGKDNGGSGRYGGGGAGSSGGRTVGGRGGDGFVSICCWGVDPTLPRLWGGGSVTPPQPEPEPPTQNGSDKGKFELGVTYQAGDIVTIGRGEYPASAAEGTYRALVTHESSFYHYPWNDPRTWERID